MVGQTASEATHDAEKLLKEPSGRASTVMVARCLRRFMTSHRAPRWQKPKAPQNPPDGDDRFQKRFLSRMKSYKFSLTPPRQNPGFLESEFGESMSGVA